MRIVTDSAADLTPEEIKSHQIEVVPLQIHFPEGSVGANQIEPDEFYRRLQQMFPQIPTTSQPSAGAFRDIYSKLTASKEDVFSVHISSGLSGTLDSATQGAEQVHEAEVHLWDSMNLSGGQRFQVLAAARAAQAGWKIPDIEARLEKIREATETVYTLDTLEYLARGGRIGRIQAIAGSLLHIKPVIFVDKKDGKYSQAGRGRTIGKAIESLLSHLSKRFDASTPLWATVLHGQFLEGAETLSRLLKERFSIDKLEVARISPVLGVHTGPKIVGVAVVPARLFDGID